MEVCMYVQEKLYFELMHSPIRLVYSVRAHVGDVRYMRQPYTPTPTPTNPDGAH